MAGKIRIFERRKCQFPNCNALGRNHGKRKDGSLVYGKYCDLHHRGAPKRRNEIPNKICQKCGWNKAPCDRHRAAKVAGYVGGNVLVLCPNCHRLEHINEQRSVYGSLPKSEASA